VTSNGWRGPGWRVFGGHPRHVKTVRDWIGRVTAAHDCPVDPDDAQLVATELFTNALRHGPPGGRVLVGYCLWRDGGRIVVCDAGGATVPRLGDPAASDQGGRGLRVVDAIAARWNGFRIGQTQVVWCDIGKPLDGAVGDTWAWLARLLAGVPLAAADTHVPPARLGRRPCGSLR
jgi:serine/threonine-protein kinase RsbW